MTTTLINMAVPCVILDAVSVAANGNAFAVPIRAAVAIYQATSTAEEFTASIEAAMNVNGPWTTIVASISDTDPDTMDVGAFQFIRGVLGGTISPDTLTLTVLFKPVI